MEGKNCNYQTQKLTVTHQQHVKELYHRLKNTNTTLYTYDFPEATAFSSGEEVNVVCLQCGVRVFKTMEKSFHVLLMCFRLLHCQ